MGNKVINLVLQHILRAHCTAACYPRISVCILVLRHVFVIRDEFTSKNKLNLSHVPFLKIEVVFNLEKIKGCFRFGKHKRLSSIYKTILVVFQLQKKWGRLPFTKNTEVVFHLKKIIEVVFHLQNSSCRFAFMKEIEVVFHLQKKCRSSSIYQKVEVVFHFH